MTETARILDQLKRAYEGPAWVGPCLRALVGDITWEQASFRPFADAHTIWEIVLHIRTWEDVVRRRLSSDTLIMPSEEEDWPRPHPVTDEGWKDAVGILDLGHLLLRQAIEQFPEQRLGDAVPGKDYSFYQMLHGVVQHDLYHAGQIAILKKVV